MRRASLFAIAGVPIALSLIGAPARAQSQGSFQPPIYNTDTDVTYVAADGILALAGQLTLGGVVGLTGFGFGKDPHPLLGMEISAGGFYGKGSFSTGASAALGGDLSMSMMTFNLSPVLKLKPLDEQENGIVGLTLYGGPQLGSTTLQMTNSLGTVWSGSMLLGALGGGVVTVRIGSYVTLLGFAGLQHMELFTNNGSTGFTSPSYGGNIKVHITPSWTLDLGSTLSLVQKHGSSDTDQAKIYVLGLTWSDRAGFDAHQEGLIP